MRTTIETWVFKTKPFDKHTERIFDEALICYKAGAYRAAFLLSYLSFQSTAKYRILSYGTKPHSIDIDKWTEYISGLENDNSWDSMVASIITIGEPKKTKKGLPDLPDTRVFKFKNHKQVIDEYINWRNKRNVCAHSKSGTINASTVECFWNFVMDNMSQMHVDGGLDYWETSIYTAVRDKHDGVDHDYEVLVDALANSHYTMDEYICIWSTLRGKLRKYRKHENDKITKFWNYIIYHNNDSISKSIAKYACENRDVFFDFYGMNEDVLNHWTKDVDGVKFKKEKLWKWLKNSSTAVEYDNLYWKCVAEMLEHHLKGDDPKYLVSDIPITSLVISPTEKQLQVLKKHTYFNENRANLLYYLRYDYDRVPRQYDEREAYFCLMKHIDFDDEIINRIDEFYHGLATHHYPLTDSLYYAVKNFLSERAKIKMCTYMEKSKVEVSERLSELLELNRS